MLLLILDQNYLVLVGVNERERERELSDKTKRQLTKVMGVCFLYLSEDINLKYGYSYKVRFNDKEPKLKNQQCILSMVDVLLSTV